MGRSSERNGYRCIALHKKGGQSVEINIDDFSTVRPTGCVGDETGAYRILLYVIPFFRITFGASQDVIKESTLPNRIWGISRCHFSRESSLERADPIAKFAASRRHYKQVQVIGKDYVPAHGDSKVGMRFCCEIDKGCMDIGTGKQSSAPIGAERDRVERITGINPIKPSWWPGELGHAEL